MSDEYDDDLDVLFSKHLHGYTGKVNIDFTSKNVKENSRELEQMQKLNLIKEKNHFDTEDDEANKEGHESGETKSKSYLKSVIEDTKDNHFVYCSYLDHFDKMWMNNKNLQNKNSLTCAGCFNQIGYQSEPIKYFTNLMKTKEMINVCVDYFETYTPDQFIKMIKEMTNINSEIAMEQLGSNKDQNIKDYNQFIAVKCKNCYTVIGVLNSETEEYIVFNSI